jgi:hypothetical protein
MDLMERDESYLPEPEPEPLFPSLVFMVSMLLIAWWIAKRHAGLPNILWVYLTFSIAAIGVGMVQVALRKRHDWPGKIVKVGCFAVGFVCVGQVLQLGVDGKRDLRAENIGIYTGIAPGIITCQRDHFEQLHDDFSFSIGPPKQNGWEAHYTYVVDGKLYRQSDYEPQPYFPIGTAVNIFYDVQQPERARLVTPEDILPTAVNDVVPEASRALLPKPDLAAITC